MNTSICWFRLGETPAKVLEEIAVGLAGEAARCVQHEWHDLCCSRLGTAGRRHLNVLARQTEREVVF